MCVELNCTQQYEDYALKTIHFRQLRRARIEIYQEKRNERNRKETIRSIYKFVWNVYVLRIDYAVYVYVYDMHRTHGIYFVCTKIAFSLLCFPHRNVLAPL